MKVGIVLLTLGTATAAQAADGFHQLTGRQLSSRLIGMELTDEVHWAYTFEKGGRLLSASMGNSRTGTWRIQHRELCLTDKDEQPTCFQVWVSGQHVELRRDGVMPDEGILQKPQPRTKIDTVKGQ